MVEEEKEGPKEGKHSSFAIKTINAFLALFVGLILTLVIMYVVSFLISLVAGILYSSGEVPAAVNKTAWVISVLFSFSVLIASTVKIYGFLEKNLDLDFLP